METMTAVLRRLALLLAFVALLSGCASRTIIPTPSLYTNTETPLFGDLAPALEGDRLQVLYATDRLPAQDESGKTVGYGAQRSASGALGVGSDTDQDRTLLPHLPYRVHRVVQ